MRRIVLLLALALPLASVALEHTPSAGACTPPVCQVRNCDFTFETPSIDEDTLEVDPGLVGAECDFEDDDGDEG
ncbi:MAG TPA: hypothetical protein VM370_08475 [Candidatus Thermoplasmatota archaeon]|nr:hypothetical protein [Candidatus Thermoplasmatota archaeon]